jgi:hypothetical protein
VHSEKLPSPFWHITSTKPTVTGKGHHKLARMLYYDLPRSNDLYYGFAKTNDFYGFAKTNHLHRDTKILVKRKI